jgi:hypothetical protein
LAIFAARQRAIRQEEAEDQEMMDALDKVEAERTVEAFVFNKTYGPAIGLNASRRLKRSLTLHNLANKTDQDPVLVAVERALAQFPALQTFVYKW